MQAGHWTRMKSMKTQRAGLGCAVLNGYLYAIGGHYEAQILATVERLDLRNPDSGWSSVASMNCKRSNFGICSTQGQIFVAGGYDEPTAISW